MTAPPALAKSDARNATTNTPPNAAFVPTSRTVPDSVCAPGVVDWVGNATFAAVEAPAVTANDVAPRKSTEFGKYRDPCAPVGSTNTGRYDPTARPAMLYWPAPSATAPRCVAPVVALIPITHAPPTGVPEPASVTVPAITPRNDTICGSTSVMAPAVTVTVAGAPWNPAVCPPVGSIT